jgi:hypothetical protein
MDETTCKVINRFLETIDAKCPYCDLDRDDDMCLCTEINENYKLALRDLRNLK